MASGYWSPLAIGTADGPTLTGAAAASCIPTTARFTFPPNSLVVGTALRITANGRISCVVTTPGTARFDLRLSPTLIMFDTGAMALNIVAKTTLPWWLDIVGTIRQTGVAGTASFFGISKFTSEALINQAVATTGPAPGNAMSGSSSGIDSAPAAITANFDTTVLNTFDMFFTQTVATGSLTVHNFIMESGSIAAT
jgi:hypothetical protein